MLKKKNSLIVMEVNILGVKTKIHLSFFIGFVVITWYLGQYIGYLESFILTFLFYLSLFLHEYGHYLEGKRLGYQIEGFVFHIIGATMLLKREILNHKDEFLMAYAGPLTSLILSFIYINIYFFTGIKIFDYLAALNFVVAFVSFIPIYPLDGGRILRALLSMKIGRRTATYIVKTFSVLTALGLLVLSIKMSFDGKYIEFFKYYFLSLFLLFFLQREIRVFLKRDLKFIKRRFLHERYYS